MGEKTTQNLFEEYYEQINTFLKFDELNIKDAQMSLPAMRHYWVGRLIYHKQQVLKLQKIKEKASKTIKLKLETESPINLTKKTLQDSISQNDVIQKIEDEILNNELLIEYLTKVEANFRDAQYGMNNLTKIIALETT